MQKYINTAQGMIVFPESFMHVQFKNIVPENEILSAGCFAARPDPETGLLRVSISRTGSVSLSVRSRETDREELERYLNNLGA